jgi:hypothetical protein
MAQPIEFDALIEDAGGGGMFVSAPSLASSFGQAPSRGGLTKGRKRKTLCLTTQTSW